MGILILVLFAALPATVMAADPAAAGTTNSAVTSMPPPIPTAQGNPGTVTSPVGPGGPGFVTEANPAAPAPTPGGAQGAAGKKRSKGHQAPGGREGGDAPSQGYGPEWSGPKSSTGP